MKIDVGWGWWTGLFWQTFGKFLIFRSQGEVRPLNGARGEILASKQ